MEYGAEVWGCDDWPDAELLQREAGRLFLGVSTTTTNEVVLGDLGWWELKSRRTKARLKLLKWFHDRDDNDICHILANRD